MNKIIKLPLLLTFLFICVLNIFAQIDPTGGNQPLSLTDIKNAFATQKKNPQKVKSCNTPKLMSDCLIISINRRGIFFLLTSQDENDLKNLGATDELIKTIHKLNVDKDLNKVDFEIERYETTFDESSLTRAFATNEAALEKLAVSSSDNVGKVFFNRGRILFRQKKYKEATGELLKAINNKFGGAGIYEFLARNYHFDKKYDKAIEYYNISIKLNPEFVDAYNNRGIAFANKKEYESAIKDYTKAIELDTKLTLAYYNRGNTFYYKKEYDSAIKDYTKTIELNPNYANAYYNRGIAFANIKEYDSEIKDYNKVIELNPNYANAYYNRGIVYKKIGKTAEAEADMKKYEELTNNQKP